MQPLVAAKDFFSVNLGFCLFWLWGVKKFLLDKGLIRLSICLHNSPKLFFQKKDTALRMSIDHLQPNEITIKNKYSLSRIDDLFNQI